MFKQNHVGRPSNEEVKRKKVKKVLLVSIPIIGVLVLALAVNNGGLDGLMGDSTSNYYCDEGAKLQGKSCVVTQNARLLGDVNGDKKINIKDATEIQKYLASIKYLELWEMVAADVNKDGDINVKDVTFIQKSIAKTTSTSGSNFRNLLYDEEYVCPNGWVKQGNLCTFTTNAYRKRLSSSDLVVGGEKFKGMKLSSNSVRAGDKVYVDLKGSKFDSVFISMSNGGEYFTASLEDTNTNHPYFILPEDVVVGGSYSLNYVIVAKNNEYKNYASEGNTMKYDFNPKVVLNVVDTTYVESPDDWQISGQRFNSLGLKSNKVGVGQKIYINFNGGVFDFITISFKSLQDGKVLLLAVQDLNTENPYIEIPSKGIYPDTLEEGNINKNEEYEMTEIYIFKDDIMKSYSTKKNNNEPYMDTYGNGRFIIK